MTDIIANDPYSLREGRKAIIMDMLQRGEIKRRTADGRVFALKYRANNMVRVDITSANGWAGFAVTVHQ